MKELRAILAKYQSAEATLGDGHLEDGPMAPRLGRDLELGIARMRSRQLVCYGGAGVLFSALLVTLLIQTNRPAPIGGPLLVAGGAIAGMVWILEYLRRLSRERDVMDLMLAFCQFADDPMIAAVIARVRRLHVLRPGARGGNTLTFDDVIQLHETAVLLDLYRERDALLTGIDPRIIAAIPSGSSPSAQLLTDLHELNRIGAEADGDVVMRQWLENAISMTRHRVEKVTFERCLRKTHGATIKDPAARP